MKKTPNLSAEKWRQVNMLEQVILRFSPDPKNIRSMVPRSEFSSTTSCSYNPPKAKPLSPGCAIGMYLSSKVAKRLDRGNRYKYDLTIRMIFNRPRRKKLLPKWMQEMDPRFLEKVQELHDHDYMWADKGLSEFGIRHIKDVCSNYDLPFKYLKERIKGAM